MCMCGGGCITKQMTSSKLFGYFVNGLTLCLTAAKDDEQRKDKHAFCVACVVQHELHKFLFDLNNVKVRSSLQRNLQKVTQINDPSSGSTHPLPREKLSKRWVHNRSVHSTRTKALHRWLYHASVGETFSLWVLNNYKVYKWDLICASCWMNVVSHIGCFYQTIHERCWTCCSLKSLMTNRRSIPHLWCHVCARSTDLLPASLQVGAPVGLALCLLTMRSFPKISLLQWPSHISIRNATNMNCKKIQHTNSARWLLLKRLAKPKSSIFNLAQSCRSSHESE